MYHSFLHGFLLACTTDGLECHPTVLGKQLGSDWDTLKDFVEITGLHSGAITKGGRLMADGRSANRAEDTGHLGNGLIVDIMELINIERTSLPLAAFETYFPTGPVTVKLVSLTRILQEKPVPEVCCRSESSSSCCLGIKLLRSSYSAVSAVAQNL